MIYYELRTKKNINSYKTLTLEVKRFSFLLKRINDRSKVDVMTVFLSSDTL